MIVSARSYIAAGIAALTAGVIAIPTTVEPLAAPTTISASVQREQVALLAAARSFTAQAQPPGSFLVLTPQRAATQAPAPNSSPDAVIKASPTAAAAAAPATQAALVGLPGLQNAIINAYTLINPWIDYGVDVAQYALSWVPVASFFAPQIGIFYYSLIEPIMTSAVYNTAFVLGGTIGLVQGITNVINDSINAGMGFVNAQINWALSFLPPLPPIPLAAAQTTTLKVAAAATAEPAAQTADTTVADKHEPTTATPVEPAAKPAAEPAEPGATQSPASPAAEAVTPKAPTDAVSEPTAEPTAPKPDTEPVKKPESTTSSSSGVSAQGEVRGGTDSATDPKKTDDTKPDPAKGDKGDGDTASTATKPAETSSSATKPGAASTTDGAGKTGDADKDAGKTKS